MHETAEHELIDLGKRGDTAAVSELFERHYKTSLNVARRILPSGAESEDAVQSAYCAAFQHFDAFRGESSFKTWITRIVVNRCLMVTREPWRRITLGSPGNPEDPEGFGGMDGFISHVPSPEQQTWHSEIGLAHDKAVCRLSPHLRAAYALYAESELSIAEIAQTLGLSIAATKSRVFRARSAMRILLGAVWPLEGNVSATQGARRAA